MSQATGPQQPLELLAPAGDMDAFRAALEAGANAVYLGLHTLNARRGAANFTAEDLPRLVEEARAKNARIFLTLNIDVTQRELGQAVRMLQLASDSGVDAVLVRDPAVIGLRRHFPKLEFHFSTQTCIANSADVLAAGELGANRVVLARELSLSEIQACSKAGHIETEVFVQGALCFCISGRCLLSSWAGGRSGNRGTCTSPCRVPWSANDQPLGTPLSMKDLTAVHRLADLRNAGVRSLKIEGRLKSAKWVSQAVGMFARAVRGETAPEALLDEATQLGAYAGRQLTWGYLEAQREDLVAEAKGRAASSAPVERPARAAEPEPEPQDTYDLVIDVTDKGIVCTCTLAGASTSWTLPKTVVHRANKAITIQKTLDWLKQVPVREHALGKAATNSPEFLLVPRAANALPDQISAAIRQLAKAEDETLRLDIPEELRSALARPQRHPANTRALGDRPDRVRLESRHVAEFVRKLRSSGRPDALPKAIIVEGATSEQIDKLVLAAGNVPLVIALPSVFFEAEIPAVRQLVAFAHATGLAIEANSWGGWKLAKDAGAVIEAGPALGILNTLAAQMLQEHSCRAVTLAVEADRKQLEEITGICPVPCSVVVYGRPALMVTRVKMDRDQLQGRTLEDRRGIALKARLEHGLWTLRPEEPFDLRAVRNNAIRAAHLVVDLVASPNPVGEWLQRPIPGEKTLRFNYGRTLA